MQWFAVTELKLQLHPLNTSAHSFGSNIGSMLLVQPESLVSAFGGRKLCEQEQHPNGNAKE